MNKITIEFNLTEAQEIALEDMFAVWNILGGVGASRWTSFYADGDGDFHPQILINGKKPKRFVNPKTGKKNWEKYKIDYDEIGWLLEDYKKEDLQEKSGAKKNHNK